VTGALEEALELGAPIPAEPLSNKKGLMRLDQIPVHYLRLSTKEVMASALMVMCLARKNSSNKLLEESGKCYLHEVCGRFSSNARS